MFLILVNNVVLSFWGNKVGDIFIENTIQNLHLDSSQVKLLHFPQIWNIPEFYSQSGNNLTVQNKIVTPTLSDSDIFIDVISYEDIEIHEGVLFYDNGEKLLDC